MDDRRPQATIVAVQEWQRDGRVHPLLCRVNASHRPLEPVSHDGTVILRCPDCDYRQQEIPASVMHAFWTGALRQRL